MKDKFYFDNLVKDIDLAFKRSPLVYSTASEVVSRLKRYKDQAESLAKEQEFYDASRIYKILMDKCIEHFHSINDEKGYIGRFLYNTLHNYSDVIQKSDIDKGEFFEEAVTFYLNEDYGFSLDIIKVVLGVASGKGDYGLIEDILYRRLRLEKSRYHKEKILFYLLKLYDRTSNHKGYLKVCKLFSPTHWEYYIYTAEKYEELGQFDRALEFYQKGINKVPEFRVTIEDKLQKFKDRMLGLK